MALEGETHEGLAACPLCEVDARWVGVVLDVYEWTGRGQSAEDVVPSPAAVVLDGVLTLARELRVVEGYEVTRSSSRR